MPLHLHLRKRQHRATASSDSSRSCYCESVERSRDAFTVMVSAAEPRTTNHQHLTHAYKKKTTLPGGPFSISKYLYFLLRRIHHCFKSIGMIHCQIGENFAVQVDSFFMEFTHQLRVREAIFSSSCIDTLYP